MSDIIKVDNLNFTYPETTTPILKNVSLTIRQNTFTTIIGENGSGKSTLAKILIGINQPDSGRVTVSGYELSDDNLKKIRCEVGIVFQNPDSQFVGATVKDDVAFGLENHLVPHDQMDSIIERVLKLVGMWEYRDRQPEALSGGQKQRVAIACAIAYDPEILILDEASSMLDPRGRTDLLKLISNLKTQTSMTILSVTHNLTEALASDYIYLLTEGQIKGSGQPTDLFTNRKLISENHLELPFILKLDQQLKEAGIPIEDQYFSEEQLIDYLWKLSLKM
ncbi:energy-coupling factor transporter ATPase [Xylocopilactobacillus apicola]|nr:energy-coupling factor transporter ATPase [Xylocopilactobacillus apicola]